MNVSIVFLWNPIIWNVSPEIIDFGFITLRWYGLLFALSFVLGQLVLKHIYKAEGRSEQEIDTITIYMIAGTVIGARLGHTLFYEPNIYLRDPIRILKVWEGGLASHGAAIGILLSMFLYCRKYIINFLWVLDRIVIVVALGGSLIRLGNLFNSEIVGKATDLPWGFIFLRNSEFTQVPRHPAQLYESISSLLIFILLYLIWKQHRAFTPHGLLFGLFVVLIFSLRFFYEFLKEPQVGFEASMALNMGQLLSIPLILIGFLSLFRAYKHPL